MERHTEHLVVEEQEKIQKKVNDLEAEISRFQTQRIKGGKIESLRRKLEPLKERLEILKSR